MTNGIAVNKKEIGIDYWYNGTSGSGWTGRHGFCLENCLKRFVGPTGPRDWSTSWMDEYGPHYTLAVPEKLVWWEDE